MGNKIYIDKGILFIKNDVIGELEDASGKFDLLGFGCKKDVDTFSSGENIYKLIKNCNREDFIDNISITLVGNQRIIHLGKKNDVFHVTVTFSITLDNWEEYYPFAKFREEFIEFTKKDSTFSIEYDDHMYHTTVYKNYNSNEKLYEIYEELENLYIKKYKEFFYKNQIAKVINFSPEHLIAGSSILQYFGKLLQEKYPDENVSVSIKQEGLKVTMLIETHDGKKEEIEEYLNRYGMVVTSQITPQEFTSNPIQVLELETKLNQAEQEIRFQKKLITLQDKTYNENLISIKEEVSYLRNELSALRVSNNENIQLLLTSLLKKDKLINKLTKSIEKRDDKETKQLLLELKEKDNQGYISLKQHIDNAIVGSIINAPSWIQFTLEIMKRMG